jgi:hypothetical protein
MSGGHYNYAYRKVEQFMEDLEIRSMVFDEGIDSYVDYDLRQRFKEHLEKVAAAMRAIEWNDSGDGAKHEKALILECLKP